MSAKSVGMPDFLIAVIGTYQAKSGDRDLFFLPDYRTNASNFTFKSFADLLQGQPEISDIDFRKLLKEYSFLMHEPIFSNQSLTVGGAFYKLEYSTVSQQLYNPYDNFSPNRNAGFGRSNIRNQAVFSGFNYAVGFIANVQINNGTFASNRIDIKQMSPQIRQPLSFNRAASVAYCVRGNLATKNYKIGTNPILYKLSDEEPSIANQSFLPAFQGVKFWYNYYFTANSSKNKLEVLKLPNVEKSKDKKRKKKQSSSFTQIKKIYISPK